MNLEYTKPKYFNCKVAVNCKICVKEHKYETCKAPKQCSSTNYLKSWKYNSSTHQKEIC